MEEEKNRFAEKIFALIPNWYKRIPFNQAAEGTIKMTNDVLILLQGHCHTINFFCGKSCSPFSNVLYSKTLQRWRHQTCYRSSACKLLKSRLIEILAQHWKKSAFDQLESFTEKAILRWKDVWNRDRYAWQTKIFKKVLIQVFATLISKKMLMYLRSKNRLMNGLSFGILPI